MFFEGNHLSPENREYTIVCGRCAGAMFHSYLVFSDSRVRAGFGRSPEFEMDVSECKIPDWTWPSLQHLFL